MGMRSATKSRLDKLPWWLLASIVFAVFFLWLIAENGDYRQIFMILFKGVGITLFVTFISFSIASVLGLIVAIGRGSKHRTIREISSFYTEILRGVPMLVLLFYIAFVGAPQLVALYNWVMSPLIEWDIIDRMRVRDLSMIWRAIIALSIGYSAFIAEIFRAGIESVDDGQIEAGRALGISRWHTFRFITGPQAFKNILPPLGNDFIALIKDSALVSVLGVQDITQLGKIYSASTFQFFETYNVVAYLYLVMTVSLSLVVRGLERRLKRAFENEA
ncbi:putative amino-acid permease protein YxeN [Pseudovibrio axinellae]|uniref:Putative amino-acid permease protein YxeN n=1 Tax=Pseudovibrio axinellae TaxID=989403 RepID=A0A165T5P9_9HYPH|nr:amino acid ABC transporter permease [Pseudovibrio axinellae]KZL05472.1 putative amino-acid permease protein YxeN [Pseudovibrio axinellae]SEP97815.1 amino acid ABC transporter membrane protein, PAAT family [Pseudovibrio axinellae]